MKESVVTANRNGGALTHTLVALLQLALLAALYAQTRRFGYVYFDDGDYILVNAPVLAGLTLDSVRWAFTSFYMSNWHPLTWMSHMLDVELFGPDPGWAHLHNVALHGFNSLLVYLLLLKFSGNWWKACVLSLIFLVHPLHVESVAWIAERKDLLSALFFLLGLLLYDHYRAQPGALRYCLVLFSMVLALLAKPMAVTFPVVLLILDYFVYSKNLQTAGHAATRRFDYLTALVEKTPLLALVAASCVVTIMAQHAGGSVAALESHSVTGRAVTAAIAYATYLKQALLPINLAAFYPIDLSLSLYDGLVPAAILIALAGLATYKARELPLAAAGLCWFLITLLPVIGLVQVGGQAHADRYMYLPSVGLLMAGIYVLPTPDKKYFQFANVLAFLLLMYISVLCYWQVSYWANRHVLFSRVLDIAGPNFQAHIHLAQDYITRDMLTEATQHARAARDLRPDVGDGYQALGNIAFAQKDFASAEYFYRIALSKGPILENILINMGIAMAEQGELANSVKALEAALEINPDSQQSLARLATYRAKLEQAVTP